MLTLNPCSHPGGHDYAVGPTAAICNRCDHMVALPVKPGPCGHTIEPATPSVGRLTCTLRHGHAGDHEDRNGASWNPVGSAWTPA